MLLLQMIPGFTVWVQDEVDGPNCSDERYVERWLGIGDRLKMGIRRREDNHQHCHPRADSISQTPTCPMILNAPHKV